MLTARSARFGARGALQLLLLLLCGVSVVHAQSLFQITSVTYGTPPSASVPAGVNGATLMLTGTLPSTAQQAASGVQGCFYTGYGSTSAIPLSPPNGTNTEPLVVPASTIQAIPVANFTAANGYSVTALVYFVAADGACDGTFDASLTNQYAVQVVAPSLVGYTGPTNVPQTNSATGTQGAPLAVTLPASGFLPTGTAGGTTSITFSAFGSVTPTNLTASSKSIYVAVPPAFAASPVGTTTSLSICNTFTGAANPICITPTPAITLTVTALVASTGTVTATPNPALVSGQTTLTAQFAKSASAATTVTPGAPSGVVSFAAGGTTLPTAKLILDTTATFATQTTSITTPAAAKPVITPAAGSYRGAQTITITDATPGAAIYYTQDGSTPTTASTLYTAPFSISSSQTVSAIAAAPGFLNSAVASAAYTVTVRPPTQLAFQVQPSNSVLNLAITPAVQVAVEDATGTVVSSSTAAVSLSLASDPGDTSLGGTTTVNAVNGIATFPNVTVGSLGTGYTLRASSGNLTSAISNAFNVTPPAITMTVQSELVGIGSTLNGSFTLGAPAPSGGLVVTLSSGTPANVTIAPASVTVASGQTSGTFTYTGVAAGNSTLSASAPNYTTGTAMTTATAAQVSLGMIPNVAPAQMQSLAVSLPTAAPPGGTTITFTIANPSIASVTPSITVPAGQQTAAANPQVTGILIGTTSVTANAPGYAPAVRPVVVTVTAAFNPGTTNINLATATNTSLEISAPAPPGGITFTLSSDNPMIASVPATVTVVAGATSVPIAITGVSGGSTTIRADSAGITEATGTVNVYSNIGMSNFTTGYELEEDANLYLPVSPSVPTTVTVTVADPTVAVISTNNAVAGQTTITFPDITSGYIGTIAVQGLKVGTTTITVSAPGYTAGTITVTVNPAGFAINSYFATYSTTTYSGPTGMQVYPSILNPDLSYSQTATLIPQATPFNISVTSSSPSVGTVTSPPTFQPNDTQESLIFQPVAAGTTTLTLGAPPAGFSVSTSYQKSVVTVTTPVISIGGQTTGVHLMNTIGLGLPEPPPTGQPVTVTVTSSDPTTVTISTSPTVAGTASVTFPNTASYGVGTIYVQGQKAGSATLTMSAPGYISGTSTVTVLPAGFFLGYPFTSFSTTTLSTPTGLNVYTSALDPTTLNPSYNYLEVSPGVAPFNVSFTNSTPAVGTLSASSVTFNPGDNQHSVTFQPVSAGTDTITLVTPAGFTTASQYQSNVATVTAPAIQVGGQETGVHLQNSLGIYLPVAPPTGHPVTVTVTSSNAAIARLSTSATTVGTASVTFTNVTGTTVGTVYIQGQAVGTATITESAADSATGAQNYTSGTNTLTVDQSGFTYYYGTHPPFTTTTFSGATQITVYATSLENGNVYNPNSLTISPGAAPATVVVTDSAPSVGTISSAALVFNPGDNNHSFSFQPVSAGVATVAISTPAGYTAGPYVSGDVTVTAPAISINNVTSAVNLQQSLGISLPQTPPSNNGNGVTVTITSSSPTLALLSKDPTVVGTSTVVFTNVTSTNVGTIYVQGQALGTAQLTETAPGYIDGMSTITVQPAGFAFYYGNESFTTTVANGPYPLTAYPFALNTGTQTLIYYPLMVNPGLGNVTVPVTSSNTSVGTTATGPSFAPGASSANFNFVPVGTGTSTITLGTPTGFRTPSQNVTATGTVQ
jgi:hypothetical protein